MGQQIIHNFETVLSFIGSIAKLGLEASSVFCIILGFFLTFVGGLSKRQFINIRLQFGTWLSLALEFQLGADILATTIAPKSDDLIKLVVLAVVRTFLNFFLQKEIKEELEIRLKQREMSVHNP